MGIWFYKHCFGHGKEMMCQEDTKLRVVRGGAITKPATVCGLALGGKMVMWGLTLAEGRKAQDLYMCDACVRSLLVEATNGTSIDAVKMRQRWAEEARREDSLRERKADSGVACFD